MTTSRPKNTAVTTDAMGRDLPGIEKFVQMGSAHPQALRDLGGRIADYHQEPVSLPLGRGLVAVVALGEEMFHRRRYLVGGGQVLAGGFGVAVVLLL